MPLKTFVKINRVTNLTDARFCAGMNVNVIGFCLEKDSPNFVDPTQFKEITGWISGIEFAAEFKNASSNEVMKTLENYPNITWIESENLQTLIELQETGLSLIYKHSIEKLENQFNPLQNPLKKHPVYIHLTSTNGSSVFEKNAFLSDLSTDFKVILGFGVTPETVENLISTCSFSGIALDSGDEIKPGLRDFDQLADILELLETED